MKWGHTESFFQLTTALNLAYFSFGGMVVPSMRRIRAEIAALDAPAPSTPIPDGAEQQRSQYGVFRRVWCAMLLELSHKK